MIEVSAMPALIVRTLAVTSSSSAIALVEVAGEIDMASAPELSEHLHAVAASDIVLELSGVAFMSAAGAQVLLDVRGRLARRDAQLVLANPSGAVRRILTATGLRNVFASGTTVADAMLRLTAVRMIQRCVAIRPAAS
jgi:anti-anti-sigma factor